MPRQQTHHERAFERRLLNLTRGVGPELSKRLDAIEKQLHVRLGSVNLANLIILRALDLPIEQFMKIVTDVYPVDELPTPSTRCREVMVTETDDGPI